VVAFLSALGAVIGSGFTIRKVIAHEQHECDVRLRAFKEGLDRRDR